MALLNLSRYYFLWFAIPVFVSLMLFAQHASADAGDTFNVTAGSTLMYDSNVFRISPSIDPLLLTGKSTRSDQVITSTATLSLNKLYGMQRFQVNGSIVDNRYHNFDFLNFIAKNYDAAWTWQLTPYFHGNLSSTHKEGLQNFGNLTGFINSSNRNIRTDEIHRFDSIFELNRSWHVIGGVSQSKLTNSRLTVQDFDNTVLSFEGGIRYALPSGSSLTYKARHGQGDFFKRPEPISSTLFDTRFQDMEHDMRLLWLITAKTSIEARIGHFERKHDHFAQRDFSGFVGNFNVNWAITGKTRLVAGWARDLSNFQTATNFQLAGFQRFSSSYIAADRFSVAPAWQITEKTALRLRYEYSILDYLGPVLSFPDIRHDSMHSGQAILDWQPVRAISLSAMLQRDHRTANIRGFDFDNIAGSITARLNF